MSWPRITSLIAARRSQGSSFRVSSSPRRRRADAHAGHEPGATRKLAAEAADKPASPVELEPDALGPGLRDWFGSLGHYPVKPAAFDTRVHGPAALTGRASNVVAWLLRARFRPGRGAGELPGDQARTARATRKHPGARVGNQAGRHHRTGPGTRHPQLNTRRGTIALLTNVEMARLCTGSCGPERLARRAHCRRSARRAGASSRRSWPCITGCSGSVR